MKRIKIAIDGHSACGKSTLARDLAHSLGYLYIDSGAMYRAVALDLLESQTDLSDLNSISNRLDTITIDFTPSGQVRLNKRNVESLIRNNEVSSIVSEVAAISLIRKHLVALQQQYGASGGIVMDGRDIGTVVFPNAELKLFVTADLDTRTQRRYDELVQKGKDPDKAVVKQNLLHRDHIDSTREDSPLRQARDAIILDNSTLTREDQLAWALNLITEKFNIK